VARVGFAGPGLSDFYAPMRSTPTIPSKPASKVRIRLMPRRCVTARAEVAGSGPHTAQESLREYLAWSGPLIGESRARRSPGRHPPTRAPSETRGRGLGGGRALREGVERLALSRDDPRPTAEPERRDGAEGDDHGANLLRRDEPVDEGLAGHV
jgi:hypothetical protein